MGLDSPLPVPGEISESYMALVIGWHRNDEVVRIITHANQIVLLDLYIGGSGQNDFSLKSEQINEVHLVC